MSGKVKLISCDSTIFEIGADVAGVIGQVAKCLEVSDESVDVPTVPVPTVNADILSLVIQWCEQHKNDPGPVADILENPFIDRTPEIIPKWDEDFFSKINQERLFQLTQAANFLEIKGLLEYACTTIANMMRGKSTEEIRKIFNIENDFTPEDEERVRQQNSWCEDV